MGLWWRFIIVDVATLRFFLWHSIDRTPSSHRLHVRCDDLSERQRIPRASSCKGRYKGAIFIRVVFLFLFFNMAFILRNVCLDIGELALVLTSFMRTAIASSSVTPSTRSSSLVQDTERLHSSRIYGQKLRLLRSTTTTSAIGEALRTSSSASHGRMVSPGASSL